MVMNNPDEILLMIPPDLGLADIESLPNDRGRHHRAMLGMPGTIALEDLSLQ
jgi:hypothetical protein